MKLSFFLPIVFLGAATWATDIFAADISGKVVDGGGNAVAGASVWVWQDQDVRKAETDVAGAFNFTGLPARSATVVSYKQGLAVGSVPVPVPGLDLVTITLGEESSLSLRVKNTKGNVISGASISNIVVNDAMAVPVSDLIESGFPWHRSDDAGVLVFPGLPKKAHVAFTLSHRDYPDLHIPYLPVGDKEQALVMTDGVKLRGRVTDEKGAAIARVRVAAVWPGSGKPEVSEALTDSDGFYRMTVQPVGFYVTASHPEFASPEPNKIEPGDEEELTADLVMPTAYRIMGTVVLPDGSPCPGVGVAFLIDKAVYEEALTQTDGKFTLLVPNREGRIRVAAPPGHMTEALSEIPVAGKLEPEMTLAPVKLKKLPLIEGTVVGEDGAPRPNVLVGSLDLTPPVWAITGRDGKFSVQLYLMPEGDKARFRAEDAAEFSRGEFEVSFNDVKPVEVKLAPFEPDVLAKEVVQGENDLTRLVRQTAPALTCREWVGEKTPLDALRGKVVVLLFWAGFDKRPATRDAIEELRALYDLLGSSGEVAFVGIHDGGEEPDKFREYVKQSGLKFPTGLDGESFDTFQAYGIQYIPQVVLIDKHGAVRHFQAKGRLLELIKSLRREG